MKIIILCVGLYMPGLVFASAALKMQLIQQMYGLDKKAQHGNATLNLFADRALQDAFKLIPKGEICGIDHDVMWQSQDPNYQSRLSFSKLQNGKINVIVGNSGTVSYALNCKGTLCKITDAFDAGKQSVKKRLITDCR